MVRQGFGNDLAVWYTCQDILRIDTGLVSRVSTSLPDISDLSLSLSLSSFRSSRDSIFERNTFIVQSLQSLRY